MPFSESVEKCGVAGVIAPRGKDAIPTVAFVGTRLQHRGQEGGGIGVKQLQGGFEIYKACERFGLVFPSVSGLEHIRSEKPGFTGEIAVCQTRYRTTGPADLLCYAQPILVKEDGKSLMGAHNGNIANYSELFDDLKSHNIILDTEGNCDAIGKPLPPSDSEILFRKIASASGSDWAERIARGVEGARGSFSLVLATDQNEMFAVRDPFGIRPISFGKLDGYFIIASETHVLDMIGAVDQTEVLKGEMWRFRPEKDPEKIIYDNSKPWKRCDFEDWYFSWPSSRRNGITKSAVRRSCGYQLGLEEKWLRRKVSADVVVCVPDSARVGAMSFAHEVNVPYEELIYKERYDDKGNRTFIGSNEDLRLEMLEKKFYVDDGVAGKVVYVIDDTGVRLTTQRIIAPALRRKGAKEVHARLLAPKFVRPCFLGTNINQREELKAVEIIDKFWQIKNDETLARETGLDSIAFLTMNGRDRVRKQLGEDTNDFCGYCHGDKGPFNSTYYDPDILHENYQLV